MSTINLGYHERGSVCGSIGGDTFASLKKNKKNSCSLRAHSIVSLNKRFNNQHHQSIDSISVGDNSLQANFSKQCANGGHHHSEEHLNRFNKSFHSFRFLVVMFGGFAVGLMLLLRYNVTVAILNMVNQTTIYLMEHPNKTIEDFKNEGYSSTGEFDWDNEIQHMIMSWYMIAYTIPQMPCTKLALLVGSQYSIPISLSLCALTALLTPMFSYIGWQWLIALRLINGIGASAVMPMMLNLVENWMPYNEITLGLTCAQLLQAIVSAANPLLAGYLCSIHWKYAFYVPGIVTIIFCILWLILVTDHPDENKFVSAKEIDLICACCKEEDNNDNNNNSQNKKGQEEEEEPEVAATWLDVFKVPSFYAYIIMWCFYCSPYSVFAFILPTYLRQFLKISVAENGFYCFIIQFGCIVSVLWPHPFLRFLQEKFRFSLTASRRFTYLIVCLMVGLSWSYVGMFHSSQLIFLFINRAFHGSTDIVVTGNLMGNFAKAGLSSIAFSMVNTVGNLSIVGFSTFCGYVLDYTGQSAQGWSYIWYALASSQLVVFFIFSTFIRAEPIEFNNSEKKNTNNNSIKNNRNSLSNIVITLPGDKKNPQLMNNFKKSKEVEII